VIECSTLVGNHWYRNHMKAGHSPKTKESGYSGSTTSASAHELIHDYRLPDTLTLLTPEGVKDGKVFLEDRVTVKLNARTLF